MAKVSGVLGVALVAWALAATAAVAEGRWQQLEDNPSCSVWNANPQSIETVTWSGACANGKAQGRGTQVWRFLWKENRYTGEMKDGKKHGHGVWVGPRGNRYEGEIREGKWHGRGVKVWASGGRYEGEFRDGKEHGRGVLVGADSGRYEGDWNEGKKHGRGVYVRWNGNRYEGDWKDGQEHGRGVSVTTNGDIYEGEYRDGRRYGRGVFIFANGDECEGNWRGSLLGTGKGTKNGQSVKCYWGGYTIKFRD